MPDREVQAITDKILALLQECHEDVDECLRDLSEAKACLGRILIVGAEMDTKLARMESDASRIRLHLDALPDDALPGRRA